MECGQYAKASKFFDKSLRLYSLPGTVRSTTKVHFFFLSKVQSFSRDLPSIDESDYTVLADTKRRARDLIIEWIFAAIDEDGPPGPPPEPLNV